VFYPIRRYSGKFSPTNRRLRYFQRALELFGTDRQPELRVIACRVRHRDFHRSFVLRTS